MSRFDLNLLNALYYLLTERNVTRAAERLHVTQPTMSGMLHRLRQQFGDQILVRIGRSMELTPLGETLIAPVRDALNGINLLVKAEPAFNPATSARTFSVMMSDYCAMTFLPRVVRRLARTAPGIRLDLKALSSPIPRLMEGDIDACISTDDWSLLKRAGEDETLCKHLLFSDEFVCIAAKNHPLRNPMTIQEFLQYPHVGAQFDGTFNTVDGAAVQQYAPVYQPTYTVADFLVIPYIVADSEILGVVQKRLAVAAQKSVPLKLLVPPFEIPNINETLLWHPRHSGDPAHAWLRQTLIEEAQAELVDCHDRSPVRGIAVAASSNRGETTDGA